MISVIIPTFNREKTILRALESVQNQTYKDLEIIVVDDASTDNTADSLSKIEDKRVKYLKHALNRGGGAARNTGILNAHGEYIAFQDSDDVWYKNKLEVQLDCLLSNNADIVFCKMNRIADGKSVGVVSTYYSEGFLKTGSNVFGIGTPTLLGKAEVFKENLFDNIFPRFQELELLIRIASKYKIYCCDQVLMDTYFDSSPAAISGNPQKLLHASKLLSEKYPGLHSDFPEVSKKIAGTLLRQSYNNTIDDEKDEMVKLAVKIDPSVKTITKYLCYKIGIYQDVSNYYKAIKH